MWLDLALKTLAGALVGAVVGYLASYGKACSVKECDAAPRSVVMRIFYIAAMAVFGAGLAWYWTHR